MGKGEEEPLPITVVDSQTRTRNADSCCSSFCCCCSRKIGKVFRFRCMFVLLLGVSVLLSALFWLPPFFHRGDQEDLDLFKGHSIVASFMLEKPLSLLKDNFSRLEDDIFDEMGVPTAKVVIITAQTTAASNTTRVIFGVDPDKKNSRISSYAKSLIRASFESLVIRQSSLSLTESLFGNPSSFEVLKFTGGITITPLQSAFPLQKVQITFNFTLNFSIKQIQDAFDELTSQLRSGLHLAPYENLYVSLINSGGSTVAPPTTVKSSVLLAVGSNPSMERWKQLAHTIKGSPTENLGLNNTEFGRVKQISLSSISQHSLNGSNDGGTPSPSPAPLPSPPQHHHHRHHHQHHHHHEVQLPPAKPPSPAPEKGGVKHSPALPPVPAPEKGGVKHSPALPPVPAPSPLKIHNAKPPDCHSGYNRKRSSRTANKHPPIVPPVAPPVPAPRAAPPSQLQNRPAPPVPQVIPASSPLPNVVFAHTHPPSKSDTDAEPPDITPSVSSFHSSAWAGDVVTHVWAIPMLLVLLALHL